MKSFIRTTVSAIVVAAIFMPASAQQPVRMSWETFAQDPARVQSLRNGVATMKSRDNADPTSALFRTSWKYWGAMHGYYGPPPAVFGTVEKAIAKYKISPYFNPILLPNFDGISDMTPPDAIAQQVWGQCQHGTIWFFAWHRLYLYYFEQVLQAAANDPTLRLPYWDYTNPNYVAMPDAYTSPTYVNAQNQTVPNPLYEPRRYPGWNVPTTLTLDPGSTDIDDPLQDTSFFDVAVQDDGFQNGIQDNVHGYVHCTVVDCPVPDMGAVGYSANDPVFWAHHANIDRMWDCWTSLGNANPSVPASYRAKTFSYIDVNGNLVTNAVADLFNGTITLPYVYEQASNCSRSQAPVSKGLPPAVPEELKAARAKLAAPVVLGNVKNHVINAAVTRKRLPIAKGDAKGTLRTLAVRGHEAVPVTVDLVLRDIQFDAHPGTQFNVSLERRDDPSKRVRVGTLSFFVTPDGHADHAAAMNRVFDVTEELRELAASNANLNEVQVVFEATSGRRGAGATASIRPKKKLLTIGEIELRVTAVQ